MVNMLLISRFSSAYDESDNDRGVLAEATGVLTEKLQLLVTDNVLPAAGAAATNSSSNDGRTHPTHMNLNQNLCCHGVQHATVGSKKLNELHCWRRWIAAWLQSMDDLHR